MTAENTQPAPPVSTDRTVTVHALRAKLCQFQRGFRTDCQTGEVVPTGVPALDSILPDRGFVCRSLSEWITAEPGSGAALLAIHVASQAQCRGPCIIVDRQQELYSPALLAAGMCLENMILVRPESRIDELWAVEQSLRCPGVGAVLCCVDRLRTPDFRRLQLAAEAGTAVGLLIRPASAWMQSGWADVRLLITPRPSLPDAFSRRLEVRCVYAKGALTDQSVELDICDETSAVRLAAGFPDSTVAPRTADASFGSVRAV